MNRLSDAQRAKLRWVFRGPDGIRAGWSIAIFLALMAAVAVPTNLIIHHYHPKNHSDVPLAAHWLILAEAMTIALVLGAAAIMGRIEHRSVWSYGLTGPNKLRNFLIGCAGGLVSLSMVVAMLYAGGYLAFDGVALHGVSILVWGLVWLFGFFLVGVSEETMFRGYLLSTLTRGMGFWPGSLLLSLLFAAAHIHNKGENVLGLLQVVTAGLVLCLLLRVTGSLWMSIGFHATWDWSQSFLYGTPDSALMMEHHLFITHAVGNASMSGGSAGPEGSVLAPIGLIIVPLVLAWVVKRPEAGGPGALPLDPVMR